MVLGPKEGSLCRVAPLDNSWEKPLPLESSCQRKEGGKKALCGLQVSEVNKNLSEICDKSQQM